MNEIAMEKTMTVKEVANILNVNEITVRRAVKTLFPDIIKNGKMTYLNETHVTAVKLRIEKNHPDKNVGVKTDLEKELLIQQAMMFQAEKIQSMQLQIDTMKPKAELADMALRDEQEHYSITDAGKHLGLSQKQIFAVLREYDLLTKNSLPTQKALDLGLLQLRSNTNCNGRNRPQSIMTMQNIYNFKEKYL